ncbi:MAG: type II secretion system F family protein [Deltaproteobacteria bacterium]|nr:type II secretion system F family protein [Deltaproteobacteria bacterium]
MKLAFSWYCFGLSQLIECGLSFSQAARSLLPVLPVFFQKKIDFYLESSHSPEKGTCEIVLDKKYPYLKQFFFIVDQALQRGTSLAEPLYNLSQDLRFERELEIEKKKHTLSTKMLLPLFVFLFPSALIVLLAPLLNYFFVGGLF